MKFTTAVLVLACSLSLVSASTFLASSSKEALLERPYKSDETQGLTKQTLLKREPKKGKKNKSSSKSEEVSAPTVPEPFVATSKPLTKILTAFTVEDIIKSLSDALALCEAEDASTIEGSDENQRCILDADHEARLKVCRNEERPADEELCVSFAQAALLAGQTATQAVMRDVGISYRGRLSALKVALSKCNNALQRFANNEAKTIACNTAAFLVYAQSSFKCNAVQEKQTCIEAAANKATTSFYRNVGMQCKSWDDFRCVQRIIDMLDGNLSMQGVFSSMTSGWIVEVAVGNMVNWGTRR
jgi:hypothetical protein